MITRCEDCENKCCKTGPGPYKKVRPATYLNSFGTTDAYNTMCKDFVDGKCTNWGTDKLPEECRTYICQNRAFTKEETDVINKVNGEISCFYCKAKYVVYKGKVRGEHSYKYHCEACKKTFYWTGEEEC